MKANQCGRSMIEMLGVLAIIGVLSVGGIAGYSKAMQKHKINQTITQVSMVAGGIQKLFATQGTRYAGADNMETLVKANIVSQDMISEEQVKSIDQQIYDEVMSWNSGHLSNSLAYGCAELVGEGPGFGELWNDCYNNSDSNYKKQLAENKATTTKNQQVIKTPIDANMTITAGNKAFAINLLGVPQEACIELASKDWGAGTDSFIGLSVGNQSVTSGVMSVADAVAGCSGESNNISFMFK